MSFLESVTKTVERIHEGHHGPINKERVAEELPFYVKRDTESLFWLSYGTLSNCWLEHQLSPEVGCKSSPQYLQEVVIPVLMHKILDLAYDNIKDLEDIRVRLHPIETFLYKHVHGYRNNELCGYKSQAFVKKISKDAVSTMSDYKGTFEQWRNSNREYLSYLFHRNKPFQALYSDTFLRKRALPELNLDGPCSQRHTRIDFSTMLSQDHKARVAWAKEERNRLMTEGLEELAVALDQNLEFFKGADQYSTNSNVYNSAFIYIVIPEIARRLEGMSQADIERDNRILIAYERKTKSMLTDYSNILERGCELRDDMAFQKAMSVCKDTIHQRDLDDICKINKLLSTEKQTLEIELTR